jgi:ribosome-associated protein
VPIRLTERCHVPDDAVEVQFVHGSGPGGQNVNKVATAVQLRLDLDRAGLPDPVRQRLERLAGNRLTKEGEILVDARRFTKPTKSAKKRRTDTKTQRGKTKRMRKAPGPND